MSAFRYVLAGIPVAAVLYIIGVLIYMAFEDWFRSPYWKRDLKELGQRIFWIAMFIWAVWGFFTVGELTVRWLR